MSGVMVVAPHADDETLGCGGTILRHKSRGDEVSWLLVTDVAGVAGFTEEFREKRKKEIDHVAAAYGFNSVHQLMLPATRLDELPIVRLIDGISSVFMEKKPEVVYVPFRGDVHTDHAAVFDAAIACTKWFRYPSIKRILAYETLSETEFGLDSGIDCFKPNVFVSVDGFLDKKIEIMKLYGSELGTFPFPRSEESIRAHAAFRGSTAGFRAAESFMLLKEIL